jgi:hypothetical protein
MRVVNPIGVNGQRFRDLEVNYHKEDSPAKHPLFVEMGKKRFRRNDVKARIPRFYGSIKEACGKRGVRKSVARV